MQNLEKIYLIILHKIWISHKKLFFLFKKNNNYKYFYENISLIKLINYWFKEKTAQNIINNIKNINIKYIIKQINEEKIQIITHYQEIFPEELKNIYNKPYLIYLKWEINKNKRIAVIWTRKMTDYWQEVIKNFIIKMVNYFTIVSGWAIWCDYEAHKQCIKNNWKTLLIAWTWIDIIYPYTNKKLYQEILENKWAIISIFPLWEKANKYNFPIRNEIIAWLSSSILIIEAQEKSGSLISAQIALDLWKNIYCIPWNIFNSFSAWTNKLIKNWEAKAITKIEDILEDYDIKANINKKYQIEFKDINEENIYKNILNEKLSINEIAQKSNINILETSIYLSEMEIKGIIIKNNWIYIPN